MARQLKPKQYKAALLIAQGEPDHWIAEELNLRQTTLHRWRQIPEFYELVMHHVQNMEQAATYRLNMARYTSASALNEDVIKRRDPGRLGHMLKLVDYCSNLKCNMERNGEIMHENG